MLISHYNLESWNNELPTGFHIKKSKKDTYKSYKDNNHHKGHSLGNQHFKNHRHFESVYGKEFYKKSLLTSLKLTQLKEKLAEYIPEIARTTASIKEFQSKIMKEQYGVLKKYPFCLYRASTIAYGNGQLERKFLLTRA